MTEPFDPRAHAPDQTGDSPWLSTSGLFCAVFTELRGRGVTRSKKPYLTFRGEVICGRPAGNEGKRFSQRLYYSDAASARLAALMKAMDSMDKVDLEIDAEVRHALLGKPFKAKFMLETQDGHDYAKVHSVMQTVYDDEREDMACWVSAARERGFYETVTQEKTDREDDFGDTGDDIPF